jgi:dihydrofolate reductase
MRGLFMRGSPFGQETRASVLDHVNHAGNATPRHEPVSKWPLVTYVNDVTNAMTQAKEAAGDKNVLVHGAATAQLAPAAGVLDELEPHVVPVLFGQGRRLFEGLAAEQIELERTRILEGEGGVTHMHYRVRR